MRWKFIAHIFAQLIFLCGIAVLSAFAFDVNARIDKSSVLLGEELTYCIEIGNATHLSCKDISFPHERDFLPFVVKSEKNCYRKSGKIIKEYVLSAFRLGKLAISGLKLKIKGKEVSIPDATINIKSVLPKDVDGINPKPEKGLVNKSNYLIWIAVFSLLLALSGYIAYRRFTQREEDDGRFHSKRAYWEIAWDRLISLDKKNLPRHRLWRQFYYELTEILRYFLQHRFSINALEMTSTELQSAIKDVDMPQEEKKAIADILFRADPVKYAGVELVDERRAGMDLDFVKQFVGKYSPREDAESQ